MMMKLALLSILSLGYGCTVNEAKPTDPLVQLSRTDDSSPSVQDWVEYNHYFRSMPLKLQQNEFRQIEKQISDRDLKEDEKHKAMFKFIIASSQVAPTLPELIKAKSFLNDLMHKKKIAEEERHFWELYSDNLNDSIRFQQLQSLVTKKYEDERLARIELEDKIKALSDIEQVADDRTETTK